MNHNLKPRRTRRKHPYPFLYRANHVGSHMYILDTTTLRQLVGALRGMGYDPGDLYITACLMTDLGSTDIWVPEACYSTSTGGVPQWLDIVEVKEYDAAKMIHAYHRRQPFSVGYTAYRIGEGRGCPIAELPTLRDLVAHLQKSRYRPSGIWLQANHPSEFLGFTAGWTVPTGLYAVDGQDGLQWLPAHQVPRIYPAPEDWRAMVAADKEEARRFEYLVQSNGVAL